ncbi:MAG: endonuclease [Desulfobacterales bacterium]|nr:MAG: endonuclease [Desulfobacterales bacterium]
MRTVYHQIYDALFQAFGPQNWWPAESVFEVVVGAVLTQNTSWSNVTKALDNLRVLDLLNFSALSQLGPDEIAPLIRPSGYYNIKARRLSNVLNMIVEEYDGQLDLFLREECDIAREKLLAVKGVGPETADSILLYACEQPVFVIDAYTHRVLHRHNLAPEETDYHSLQEQFLAALEPDVQYFNEYHALLVKVASQYCKKRTPLCEQCPLRGVNL